MAVLVVSAALSLPPAVLAAGWTDLGGMPRPAREGSSLVFKNVQGIAAVSVLGPEAIRVRFSPTPAFGRDHSYAVVSRDLGSTQATFDVGDAQSTITTAALKVVVRHDPFRVSFLTAQGESLDEDDAERGTALLGSSWRLAKRLRDDEHVYGFGEKMGRLDKRGKNLGGYSYVMWNSDTYGYQADTDPIYASMPFYIVTRGGRAHGIFLDNTFRSAFDVGHETAGVLTMSAPAGELDYYFLDGPTPKDVIARYTTLTGRIPLPALWTLGFHQCRYSYYPESKVRFIADNFRQRRIPADTLWLDIHYLDEYAPLTWNKERFPDPARMIGDLRRQGFHIVTIVDPHPKAEKGWGPYESGLAGGYFTKNPDGSVYEGPVWPSNSEKNPRPSVLPDFSKPAARDWWGAQYKPLVDAGVAGIWNDMNEPAVFKGPLWTAPLDLVHDNEGQPTSHREIHNVYGQLMTRSTYEGLLKLKPDSRPFVLTRATFSGGQRYAAIWPGDNTSDWSTMRDTIPVFSNMGMSGFSFVGADIGGFTGGGASPELFTRWLQMGVFYPFMRVHIEFDGPNQEPWAYGNRHEAVNRRAIELRYELLPQIYTTMEETSRTGIPALRPLMLEFPGDEATWGREDEFLFGSALLVAPVLREGATQREVYLPEGAWYDYWTGRRQEGKRSLKVPVTLDTIPLFVRGGSLVFRQPVVQHTGEMPGQPLIVAAYGDAAQGEVYEDDGASQAYRTGAFSRRKFQWARSGSGGTLSVAAPTGSFRPAARDLVLQVPGAAVPSRVTVGTRVLEKLAKPGPGEGWRIEDDGTLSVRIADPLAAVSIGLE